uniref:IVSP2-like protein n=1 Tax=Glypta fumiferanae TaxID=389681 RepID=A0A0F6Q8D2_9HYME|nr:IVSP2-like protein [Glypta fumiferanae]
MSFTTSISGVSANENLAIRHIAKERNEVLNSIASIYPNIVGNVKKFNGLYGPSNTLTVVNHSSPKVHKSKNDYVDIGYKFNDNYSVLLGPMSFFGLCASDEKIKTEDIERSLQDGSARMMIFVSNFACLQEPESAELMMKIVNDLHAKMDTMMKNEKAMSQIIELFPKFDRSTFDKSKELDLQRHTKGHAKLDRNEISSRLEISMETYRNNDQSSSSSSSACYETVRGISRAKNYMHFYPPAERNGYLLLNMPHVRLSIGQTTEFTVSLSAKFMFAKRLEILTLPECFDMKSGKIFKDSLVIDDNDNNAEAFEQQSSVDEPMESEEAEEAEDTRVDDTVNGTTDSPLKTTLTLGATIINCINRHDAAYVQSLKPRQFEDFVNACISSIKKKKITLIDSNGSDVNYRRIPEISATKDSQLETMIDDLNDVYGQYHLTKNIDDIIDDRWDEIFTSQATIGHRRQRTPTVTFAQTKKKRTKSYK